MYLQYNSLEIKYLPPDILVVANTVFTVTSTHLHHIMISCQIIGMQTAQH